MKILLVGEFSGLHNFLKKGLIQLGHDVTLLNYGDSWKKFPTDINIHSQLKWPLNMLSDELNLKLIGFSKEKRRLKEYDVVQFINPLISNTRLQILFNNLSINEKITKNLIRSADKSFLLAAGDDNFYFKAIENNYFEYDPISQVEKLDINWIRKLYSQWWKNKLLRKWNIEMLKYIDGVIPCAYDYTLGYKNFAPEKTLEYIPFPIHLDDVPILENKVKNGTIKVIHGINRRGFKGTIYVEQAFQILKKKYPNYKFEIHEKLSYNEYLNYLSTANIVVDQLNSYSYGMNALLSLAMGKIVITGCEDIIKTSDGFGDCRGLINSRPDVDSLVNAIEKALDYKNNYQIIANESREYVKKYHDSIIVANKYINNWNKI